MDKAMGHHVNDNISKNKSLCLIKLTKPSVVCCKNVWINRNAGNRRITGKNKYLLILIIIGILGDNSKNLPLVYPKAKKTLYGN